MATTTTHIATTTQGRENDSIPTAGEVLAGGMLELVRDPVDRTRAALLHWDGQLGTIRPAVVLAGRRYVPIEIAGGLLERLPSTTEEFGSIDELFNDVHAFIAKYLALREEESFLMTFFSLSTSFCDCLHMCPCILFYGPSPATPSPSCGRWLAHAGTRRCSLTRAVPCPKASTQPA